MESKTDDVDIGMSLEERISFFEWCEGQEWFIFDQTDDKKYTISDCINRSIIHIEDYRKSKNLPVSSDKLESIWFSFDLLLTIKHETDYLL